MTAVRFTVDRVFDLKGRGGILALGQLMAGVVDDGMALKIEGTDQVIQVLGVEFHSPIPKEEGMVMETLVIERTDPMPVRAGTVLISPA
jgi:selenocysteine-specific translation elongation factor